MQHINKILSMTLATTLLSWGCHAQSLPDGYWSAEQADSVLQATRTVFLETDLSELSDAENAAVQKLLAAGQIINRIYEDFLHPQALKALGALKALDALLSDEVRLSYYALPYSVKWAPELHERLALRLRDSSRYRFVTVRYGALDDV